MFRRFGLDKAEARSKVELANLQANIVSTLQAGCFAGALIAAPVADKLGRKRGLLYTSIVVLIGVIMQFNAWGHLEPLYIGRFINGLGKFSHLQTLSMKKWWFLSKALL